MRHLALAVTLLPLITLGSLAQPADKAARSAQLKAEIAALKKKLAGLEAELAALEGPTKKSDLDLLQGTWKQTNAKKVWTYTFAGKILRQVSNKGADVSVAVSLDETADPRRMTWRGTKGESMTALYKVEGDRLKLVWSIAVHNGLWRKLQDGPNVFYMEFDRER